MDIYSDGDRYDALNGAEAAGPEVEFYRRLAYPGCAVLELGCGTGRLSLPLARAGLSVTGLDLSERMLATARKKSAEAGLDVRFERGDARQFDLERRFQLILFPSNAIAHLETERAVESCFRCVAAHLADGGRFVVHAFNPKEELLQRDQQMEQEVGRFVENGSIAWTVTESGGYDSDSQIQLLHWRWVASDGRTLETELRLRMYWPEELDRLVAAAGLAVLNRRGDFSATPFTVDARHQILTVVRD